MKKFPIFILFLLVLSIASQGQTTTVYCMNNRTAQLNVSVEVCADSTCENATINQQIVCPFGCDNTTGGLNDCNPDRLEPNVNNLIAPIMLFGVAFLLLYIGINMTRYIPLQFLFLGFSLITIIVNAWYAQRIDVFTFQKATGNVLTGVYYLSITLFSIVILYFILDTLAANIRNAAQRKRFGTG